MLKSINIRTKAKNEFVDITSYIHEAVNESSVKHGICYLYVPHTTAGITINEGADPSVVKDIQSVLSKHVPSNPNYLHSEGNSDAHIKSTLVGMSEVVSIDNGRLILGTWQSVFFCEFDGPRNRRIIVKILGDKG
ncbi:MAG: YjbQ family protein [Nitrospirae bacterium]|nr:YjbQ family protein [Nitrospirota bacterium]